MLNDENAKRFHELKKCKETVEERLDGFFIGSKSYGTLMESMRYSLLNGGKRIRAAVCIKLCEASGGAMEDAIFAACSIEMLHAYTLIHDDLPCMDDDDTRRGKPSNHIKYGESTAILAGDALQAAAFSTLLESRLPHTAIVSMAQILANAAGFNGVCGGQLLDLAGEGQRITLAELTEIHSMKTVALMTASAMIGVVAANGGKDRLEAAREYASSVGLAFQIRDDVLDTVSTTEEIGKPAGSDCAKSKATFVSLLGVARCEEIIQEETAKAIAALQGRFEDAGFLIWLAHHLADRKN